MRLKLEGCAHPRTFAYDVGSSDDDAIVRRSTCLTCYRRFRSIYEFTTGRVVVQPDVPAVGCSHANKKPISEAITKRLPYQDALCTDCGRVLRHPDGPGEWTEVLFYGLLIHEEP